MKKKKKKKVLRVRGSWRPSRDCNILTSPAPPDIAECRSRSPDAQPEALGPTLLAFFTAFYHQLVWSPSSIGGPEGPFDRVWLSLPYLVSNSSDLQLSRGSQRPLLQVVVAFSTTSFLQPLWSPSH